MGSMAIAGFSGLFGDRVYSAKDLTRRTAEVLDQARTSPVTISRKQEQYAILKREQAAELVKGMVKFPPIIELLEGALNCVEGKKPGPTVAWIEFFDQDDVRKMVREVLEASLVALSGAGSWDAVDATVHEWRESAIVGMSGVLDGLAASTSEVSLPDPRAIVEAGKAIDSKR